MASIGKRLRFEIFKRDNFVCLYCGRTPPDVTLQVDHLIPVSKGGDSAESNLVTSCFDCNSGKSNNLIATLPINPQQPGHAKEKLEQLRAISEAALAKRERESDLVDIISDHWMKSAGEDPSEFRVTAIMETAIRQFLKALSPTQIIECVDMAFEKFQNEDFCRQQFKYFCGCCWRKIKGDYPAFKKR